MRTRADPFPTFAAAAGFTLAEVLAALLLMAIVIPAGMQAMSIASRAGQLGQRKAEAAQVAESVLAETAVTSTAATTPSSGSTVRNGRTYAWSVRTETWPVDAMTLVTVEVTFTVQNAPFKVSLSTLKSGSATTTASTL